MMIVAELLAVLNTLTEHDFHDAFNNDRRDGNGANEREGTISRGWWPVGPKLAFDLMAAPVPGIMDTTLHCDIRNSHS
jgi:hypothetical protein